MCALAKACATFALWSVGNAQFVEAAAGLPVLVSYQLCTLVCCFRNSVPFIKSNYVLTSECSLGRGYWHGRERLNQLHARNCASTFPPCPSSQYLLQRDSMPFASKSAVATDVIPEELFGGTEDYSNGVYKKPNNRLAAYSKCKQDCADKCAEWGKKGVAAAARCTDVTYCSQECKMVR